MNNTNDGIGSKVQKSIDIINQAYDRYPLEKLALAWTGGKDSTLLLWLVREFVKSNDNQLPRLMFINEGNVFDEVFEFVRKVGAEWDLDVYEVNNNDVLSKIDKIGDTVYVNQLNNRNQAELDRLGFEDESFPFEPESYVGNHLMKTVAMNMWIEDNDVSALMTGIRWDEQGARSDEEYFSPRKDPDHVRIHPILHFTEREVWETTLEFDIPYVDLYEKGYRSLGAAHTTSKTSDKPAWEQDLENTTERSGRRQDKEDIMGKLRDLGYM